MASHRSLRTRSGCRILLAAAAAAPAAGGGGYRRRCIGFARRRGGIDQGPTREAMAGPRLFSSYYGCTPLLRSRRLRMERSPNIGIRERLVPRNFSASSPPSSSRQSHSSSSFIITNWYTNLLDNHPVLTKMVSSGLIAAAGDALCQVWFTTSVVAGRQEDDDGDDDGEEEEEVDADADDHDPDEPPSGRAAEDHEGTLPPQELLSPSPSLAAAWDWTRTGRFGMLGTFLVAPTVHVWYNRLHHWTSALALSSSPWRLLASRVAIDQLLFAPAFTAVWLVALRALEGHRPVDLESLKDSVPDIVVANWALWVPAQLVNFAMVPLKFQVLYSNVVALVWNVYLSHETSSRKSRGDPLSGAARSSEP